MRSVKSKTFCSECISSGIVMVRGQFFQDKMKIFKNTYFLKVQIEVTKHLNSHSFALPMSSQNSGNSRHKAIILVPMETRILVPEANQYGHSAR